MTNEGLKIFLYGLTCDPMKFKVFIELDHFIMRIALGAEKWVLEMTMNDFKLTVTKKTKVLDFF